jgi:transposase
MQSFTALKSALTQFWCSLGTCGTLAGIDDKSVISRKPLLRSEQRDASPRVKTDQGWTIEAHGQDCAVCPGCQSVSRSRHSRYWRSLQDLPIQGTPVFLRVHVGRWRCHNAGCKRRIFTERPFNVCAPHARQTKRSDEIIAVVGRALGGRPGQRLMGRLGMPLSADTLIRRIKGAARWSALPRVIRVLGVDDWAWCKGQNFGTILVDLERRQVVDLLPTRSADSFGQWFAQHPEVTTVSRDRQGVYTEGARRGAPEAVQVADRFHLVLNLTQAVERELAVNRRHLRIASPRAPALPLSPTTEGKFKPSRSGSDPASCCSKWKLPGSAGSRNWNCLGRSSK